LIRKMSLANPLWGAPEIHGGNLCCVAFRASNSHITCVRALTLCSAKTRLYHGPFSLRSLVQYSNFLKSLDSITIREADGVRACFRTEKGVSPHAGVNPVPRGLCTVRRECPRLCSRNVQELKSSMIRSRGMSVLAPPGLPHTGDISP